MRGSTAIARILKLEGVEQVFCFPFTPILDALVLHGDHYMHLADLTSYVKAQEQVGALYRQPDAWARKAILNVGHSGGFSSDRTISEYAADIWNAEPCPVE